MVLDRFTREATATATQKPVSGLHDCGQEFRAVGIAPISNDFVPPSTVLEGGR